MKQKILFMTQSGIGNVIQEIPAYLCLKEKFDIEVIYLEQAPTDKAFKAGIFPYEDIKGYTWQQFEQVYGERVEKEHYDFYIRKPYIMDKNLNYIRKNVDSVRELQSEVERNMMSVEYFGLEKEMKREWILDNRIQKPCEYIVVHNGGLNTPEWAMKKYPKFPELVKLIKKHCKVPIVSIGAPGEFVEGTEDFTGLTLRQSGSVLRTAKMALTTDTWSYHATALFENPGIALFTATSRVKNYDPRFHHTIKTIQMEDEYDCVPGQWGWTWGSECKKCNSSLWANKCQNIPTELIMEEFKKIWEDIDG